MKISTKALSLALLAGASSADSTDSSGLPAHHPPVRGQVLQKVHPTLAKFSSQFRCPYAQEWLTKGAHKAAIDLGLTSQDKIDAAFKNDGNSNGNGNDNDNGNGQRRIQEDNTVATTATATIMGSCSFNNPWSGPSCLEFRGDGWTVDSMTERCAVEPDSTLAAQGEGCPTPSELAGWCVKTTSEGSTAAAAASNTIEASSMMISAMSDCDGNKMACGTFMGGTWEAAGSCGGSASADATAAGGGGGMMGGAPAGDNIDYANMGPPSSMDMGDTSCMIAPGAIGAAHQAGYSNGYSASCKGTPAEGSPYMWPMAWSADVDTQSMEFGSDDVVFHNQGRVFYRLDKNWKRSDTTYSKGTRRGVGQGPCDNPDTEKMEDGVIACKIDIDVDAGTAMTTMIHRGSKMYFITWKNDTDTDVKVGETDPSKIDECNYLDLMVIGNIRPDWFLDDRGDDTDVQYLGDQHAYYTDGNNNVVPRLVKQWRKKDFASQYFTMSVTGNPPNKMKNQTEPIEDSIHWPLILNIPGEGFGDDMLQVYKNHSLLTDDDDAIFELVENLEASGGSCPLISSMGGENGFEGDGDVQIGPPTTDVQIPSNLEVDPNSWFTNVYTFSPVWKAPMKQVDDTSAASGGGGGVAVTEEGRVRVESCYDPSTKSVELSVEFMNIEPIATSSGSQLPWMSLGYRIDEVCSMNPPDGSDSKIIMVNQSPIQKLPKAYAGSLSAAAQRLDMTAITSIYDSFWPLEKTTGYSDVSLSTPMLSSSGDASSMIQRSADGDNSNSSNNNDSVTLKFKQQFDEKPQVMHLMYAIGMSAQLGIHTSRSCFDVVEFPTCSTTATTAGSSSADAAVSNKDGPSSSTTVFIVEDSNESESSSSALLSMTVLGVVAICSTFFLL